MTQAISIVEVSAPNDLSSGDYHYRAAGPFAALIGRPGVDRVVCITTLHPRREALLRQADVLVLNNLCDPDVLPALRDRREQRRPTVYDIHDDVTAFLPDNPVHYFFAQPENQRLVFKTISLCDALEANNQALLQRFGRLSPVTALFPNQLQRVPPLRATRDDATLTIGWAGSAGHLPDVAAVAPALRRFVCDTPGVRLATMGSARIAALFADLPAGRHAHTEPGTLADYYRFVSGLDVGLAPLSDVPYNHTRSDVKFLEYAAHGAVPVVQRLRPYLDSVRDGHTGFLFNDPAELVQILTGLSPQHPDGRARLRAVRAAAHAEVQTARLESAHADRRLALYSSLVRRPAGASPNSTPDQSIYPSLVPSLDPAVPTQVPAQPTPFERTLYQALVLLETRGAAVQAAALLDQAAALEPEAYLPDLLRAKAGTSGPQQAARHLAEALRKNPGSVNARLLLGDLLRQQGQVEAALQQYEQAARYSPGWEVPYLRVATALEGLGAAAEARQFRELAASVATRLPETPG